MDRLAALTATPPPERDEAWCTSVLSAAPNAALAALEPRIQNGPDTFPYGQLAIPDSGAFEQTSIVEMLDALLEAGAGAVIHVSPRRDQPPLWVFSFGDLLAYSLFSDFRGDPAVYNDPTPPNPNDRQILKASPSLSFLPATARAAMGRFMRGPLRHPSPKVGLVAGASLQPRQNLMVNLRLQDYGGDQQKHGAAMRYLLWFIPKSYGLLALPDDWPDSGMSPL